MPKNRPWWMKGTAAVNYAITGILILFILWATFLR